MINPRPLTATIALAFAAVFTCPANGDELTNKPVVSTFKRVTASSFMRHMVIDESGKHLFAIAGDTNTVIRYDVATGQTVSSPKSGTYRMLLARGDGVYVLDTSLGVVVRLSGDTLKSTQSMAVGEADPFYLSAPRGKHFNGSVYVSCGDGRVVKELQFSKNSRMTLNIPLKGVKTMDYAGHGFISQQFDSSPSGVPTAFSFRAPMGEGRGDHDDTPFLQQYQPNDFWYGSDSIYAGSPPRLSSPTYRGLLLPEVGGNCFYGVFESSVVKFSTTYPFHPLQSWVLSLPQDLQDLGLLARAGRGTYFHHLATTIGEVTTLFIFDVAKRTIWRCDLKSAAVAKKWPVLAPGGRTMFPAFSEECHFSYSAAGKQNLFLNGMTLRFMSGDCTAIDNTLRMPARYSKVFDRGAYLVALHTGGIHVLDRKTARVIRQITLDGAVSDIALHPSRPITYIAVHDSDNFTRDPVYSKRIAILQESTGTVTMTAACIGNLLACDPNGRFLYAALKHRVPNGWELGLFGYNSRKHRETHILLRYVLDGDQPRLAEISTGIGANLKQLAVAPRGDFVSPVSGGGVVDPETGRQRYVAPGFAADDLSRPASVYDLGSFPQRLAYHPSLQLTIGTNGKVLSAFALNGTPLPRVLPKLNSRKIVDMTFSPDGTRLLVQHVTRDNYRLVQAIPLMLEEVKPYSPAEPKPPTLPTNDLENELYGQLKMLVMEQLSGGHPPEK